MASIAKYVLPDDLYYDRDSHLWLRRDGDTVTLGLDMLGQESMGDLAYVAFEPVGEDVQRGDPLGSLEAAKMVAPILAPISGKIVNRNDAVARQPHLVNESPYDRGWLLVVEPTRWYDEAKDLLSGAENIHAFLASEIKRYREQGWID
jgi:glycine cleavage system H protein